MDDGKLLLDLPLELFNAILSELSIADRECLRLACGALYNLMGSEFENHGLFGPESKNYRYLWNDRDEQHYEFLQRLLLPGNILQHGDLEICGGCFEPKHVSNFQIELNIDDNPICRYCIFVRVLETLGPGHKLSHPEEEDRYTCAACGTRAATRFSEHRVGGKLAHRYHELLCTGCHEQTCKTKWSREKRRELFSCGGVYVNGISNLAA